MFTMWNPFVVRRHRIVAGWLAALLCVVCFHLYFSFNTVQRSPSSGRWRKLKLEQEERLQAEDGTNRGGHRDKIIGVDTGSQSGGAETRENSGRGLKHGQIQPRKSNSGEENVPTRSSSVSSNPPHTKSVSSTDGRHRKLYEPPSNETPKKRLPQAIMIGTGKCGTRALLEYLGMHPYIVHAAREVHFFDREDNFNRGLEWYRAQMPASYSNQVTIEKSPAYVEHPRSAPEIYKMNNTVRLLWVVKDPVVRLMSAVALQQTATPRHFYLETVNGSLAIKKYNNAVNRGKYIIHLRKWRKFFPLSQIHILDGGALKKEPVNQIQKAEQFLGLPPLLGPANFYYNATKGFYCLVPFSSSSPSCLGKSKGRKHPELNETVKNLLYHFYRPYNEEFFKVLGRRFDWEPKDYT